MRAAPGGPFAVAAVVDFNFKFRRMLIEILCVVGNLKTALGTFDFEGVRQANVAELKVMAVGFTVGGNIQHRSVADGLRKSVRQFAARSQ